MRFSRLFYLCLTLAVLYACKEGKGGKATISGAVKHHDELIPGAVVYIKYDADEFPGVSPDDYDDRTIASNPGALYQFKELRKGQYYLFSTGYDSTIFKPVLGGLPVVISKSKENFETDVSVTE